MLESKYPADAWKVLRARMTEERQEKMMRAASLRTNHIRLVVQDIHNPHNISACMRSAEAFGVLNIDVVNLTHKFQPSTVARGVHNWVRTSKYKTVKSCADKLHSEGYAIAAAMPNPKATSLYELPLDKPVAVLFGNEHAGVSPEWGSHIDHYFTIPMNGLVESLNISVAAAVTMHHLTHKCETTLPKEVYHLNDEEKEQLLSDWTCHQIKSWEGELERLRT